MDSIESIVPLTQADLRVLRESIWHSVQRGDVPDADRARLHRLHDHLRNYIED